MSDGYGSTGATTTWIGSDGTVTNHDPDTEMGFWVRLFHNECDRSAHLEREVERLREKVDKWRDLADSLARFGNCESPDCPDCDRDWKLTYQNYEQEVRGE